MEFQEVVDRRRMVRAHTDEPVDPAVVDRILRNAVHAPSAGFSQGWAFLVLDTSEDIGRFNNCWPEDGDPDPREAAPLTILALSCMQIYLERYAEPDKGDVEMDPSTWERPYWDIDTEMACLLMLLTVVDEGLGASFFGIPLDLWDAIRDEFNIPPAYDFVGVTTIGHRGPRDPLRAAHVARGRKPIADVVHRNNWYSAFRSYSP